MMQDRFKFRVWCKTNQEWERDEICITNRNQYLIRNFAPKFTRTTDDEPQYHEINFCTGLKDKNGKLIYERDIIVIPNQYPFYDYKNKEDMKQDLNSTEGEIKGESILNYIGIVEWIYSQWQYVYHCVNPNKRGISEGINQGLNDFGFDETRNTCYEVIGNIYENSELILEDKCKYCSVEAQAMVHRCPECKYNPELLKDDE